jgi:hypothetical protein
VNNPDTAKASGRRTALRHLRGTGGYFRSNLVAYVALFFALSAGGGYALAAVSASNGTIAVCVDKGSVLCTSLGIRAADAIRTASGSVQRSTARPGELGRQSHQTGR